MCNQKTRRLEWADGSKVAYTKNNITSDFDCTKHLTIVSEPAKNDWLEVASDRADYTYTVMCVARFPAAAAAASLPPIGRSAAATLDPCWDYDRMDVVETGKAPCYKVRALESDLISWTCAEQSCENEGGKLARVWSEAENKFFWRTAIGNGVLGGMHIGFHSNPLEEPVVWRWVDDDTDVNAGNYKNFINGFPIVSDPPWKCGSMQTSDIASSWVNIDCDSAILHYVCRRNEYATSTETCPTTPPLENTQITSPGFPPNIPCDYMLVATAGKRVQLTVFSCYFWIYLLFHNFRRSNSSSPM
ncbi:hypothetical protein PRIPAC_85387, partial [Pristionchus pacificus]